MLGIFPQHSLKQTRGSFKFSGRQQFKSGIKQFGVGQVGVQGLERGRRQQDLFKPLELLARHLRNSISPL
jgi:hypothetical protein